jgi:tRNA G10  N-methylase Trm11
VGDFSLYNPKIEFAITVFENNWYFGELKKNDISWQKHLDKPENFSNSLPIRVAKSIVNIATSGDSKVKLVDPCCGVGTVLLEAFNLGYTIDGYDISHRNVEHTKENIKYYNYDISCIQCDIKNIKEHYDAAIIDLPYDLYAKISYQQQYAILKNSYNICDKLVLVTNSDNRKELEEIGYKNIEMSYVIKQQFKRYIFVGYH